MVDKQSILEGIGSRIAQAAPEVAVYINVMPEEAEGARVYLRPIDWETSASGMGYETVLNIGMTYLPGGEGRICQILPILLQKGIFAQGRYFHVESIKNTWAKAQDESVITLRYWEDIEEEAETGDMIETIETQFALKEN